jgi:hypothetical protein
MQHGMSVRLVFTRNMRARAPTSARRPSEVSTSWLNCMGQCSSTRLERIRAPCIVATCQQRASSEAVRVSPVKHCSVLDFCAIAVWR